MTRVVHRTRYVFDDVVPAGAQLETCLEPPRATFHQLLLRPLPASIDVVTDPFGNRRHHARFDAPLARLEVTTTSDVSSAAEGDTQWRDVDLAPASFLGATSRAPTLSACAAYAAGHDVVSLVRRIHRDFAFDRRATNIDTPLARFFALRRGVCQDFAHLAIACLRALSVPARYISGYSTASVSSGRAHAWVAAYVDGVWVELDATMGVVGKLPHVPVATGRDYDDVPAVRGTVSYRGGCRIRSEISLS